MTKLLKKNEAQIVSQSSFRDPVGFIFSQNNLIYRQINLSYKSNFNALINSGLYNKLTSLGYLIPHKEIALEKKPKDAFKIIQPEKIPFISYPYEWCFSMLKAAALLTLNIQKIALEYKMSLKDASAFNIQFLEGKPILIDTLSFETYEEGKPWIAYKQFIEHFLTPLALMSLTDVRLNRLSTIFLDGIPVDLASRLLPFRSRFKPSLLFHIYAHVATQRRYSQKKLVKKVVNQGFSYKAFLGLLDNLEGTINSFSWNPKDTQWSNYYEGNNNYDNESLIQKAEIVKKLINSVKPKTVWDLGANRGFFSRIAAKKADLVISLDNDLGALEKNYLEIVKAKEKNILPIFADLTNPAPSLGWGNSERESLLQRGPTDIILALALIHHLAISHNMPFSFIASLFSKLGKFLIVEFIPKEDSQVQKLLANREDIFQNYNKEGFEKEFKNFYQIKKMFSISKSKRILYMMESKKV